MIGSDLIFLDVATGFPGSIHDSRLLRHTSLFENQEILTKPEDIIENARVRPMLLGDGGYPLRLWIMRPYIFTPMMTPSERKFNNSLSSARVSVERGFGILKARWRCLLKRLDCRVENISAVIITCFALHNFCQINGERYIDDDGILDALIHQERQVRRRRQMNNTALPRAEGLRTALKTYITNNY